MYPVDDLFATYARTFEATREGTDSAAKDVVFG